MGTPLPPTETGDPCTVCWGPGKPFGDRNTPKVIQLRLTSMLPGEFYTQEFEQFLLTTHYLEQFGEPCHYRIESNGFRFDLLFEMSFTFVLIVHLPTAHGVFTNTSAPVCSTDIENLFTSGIGLIMYGGFANLTWEVED